MAFTLIICDTGLPEWPSLMPFPQLVSALNKKYIISWSLSTRRSLLYTFAAHVGSRVDSRVLPVCVTSNKC